MEVLLVVVFVAFVVFVVVKRATRDEGGEQGHNILGLPPASEASVSPEPPAKSPSKAKSRRKPGRKKTGLEVLPPVFVVLDLETTGLSPYSHEIIEIGAIRANRDSDNHDSFHTLVKPKRKIPKKITGLTGITQEMVDAEGCELEQAITDFVAFIGNYPLVTYNAPFDMGFLQEAAKQFNLAIPNETSCALRMARRAWPGRSSYKLADLARDGSLSEEGTHRALEDCQRALTIYCAAASILGQPN